MAHRGGSEAVAALDQLVGMLPQEQADHVRAELTRLIDMATAEVARRLRVAQEAGRIGTYEICLKSGRTYGSPRFNEIFGLPPDHNPLDSVYWVSILHPDDRPRVLKRTHEAIREGRTGNVQEYRIVLDDMVRWVSSCDRVDLDADGRPTFAFGAIQDITERKTAEEALWRAANADALTGLSNRRRFREELEAMIASGAGVGLLIIDLDRLKTANDVFGHAAGDHLILTAAQRLAACAPADAVIGRLGGDEFALAAPAAGMEMLARVGDCVVAALRDEVRFSGAVLDCGGSAGGALCPDHAADAEGLMRAADVALLVAKLSGRGRCRLWAPGDEAELARLTRAKPRLAAVAA